MSITLTDPGAPNLEFERPAGRARLERAAAALASRGFLAQIADSAKEARRLVLEAIPDGAEVHVALSETMRELGITAEIDQSGRYDSVRSRLSTLDRATQGRQIAKLGAAPDLPVDRLDQLGEVGVRRDGDKRDVGTPGDIRHRHGRPPPLSSEGRDGGYLVNRRPAQGHVQAVVGDLSGGGPGEHDEAGGRGVAQVGESLSEPDHGDITVTAPRADSAQPGE